MAFGRWMRGWRLRPERWLRPTYVALGDVAVIRTACGDLIYLSCCDLHVGPRIALDGFWEPPVSALLGRLLRRGMVAVELGANVGYHTLGMARAVGPEGRVHAFEANPEVARLLALTLSQNKCGRQVTLHHAAACDRAGTIELLFDPSNHGSGHLAWAGADARYTRRFDVPAVRLDDVLASVPRIDLLRMDIEGAEGVALQGARELIERSPELRIVTEWDAMQMRVRSDVAEVAAWLAARGFSAQRIRARSLDKIGADRLADTGPCELLLSRRPGI